MSAILGFNVDHIATLRNTRGENYPDLMEFAKAAIGFGADQITAHLREDRRHIKDNDIFSLKELSVPLNMEMALTDEMIDIALKVRPNYVCIVPEKRFELTTEGGLNIKQLYSHLDTSIKKFQDNGIKVSLFIDSDINQCDLIYKLGCDAVEINTGVYSNCSLERKIIESRKIEEIAKVLFSNNIRVHAGHGLNLSNIDHIAKIKEIVEFNIGHYIVSYAILVGLQEALSSIKNAIELARTR